MGLELYSREEELASLHAFIGDARGGLPALVLEGEAGIGKSALWLAAVELARRRSLCVLSSRPAELERSLAHVGLGDLFEDLLDDVLPALSTPRRRALEVAPTSVDDIPSNTLSSQRTTRNPASIPCLLRLS
jgi:predicted ATPase